MTEQTKPDPIKKDYTVQPMDFTSPCASIAFSALALSKRREWLSTGMDGPISRRESEALTFFISRETTWGRDMCQDNSPMSPIVLGNLPVIKDRSRERPNDNPDCPEKVDDFRVFYQSLVSQYEKTFPNGPPDEDVKIPLELERGLKLLNSFSTDVNFMCGRGPEKMPGLNPFRTK